MITMTLFAIVIEKKSKTEAALYYNDINKKWVSKFQSGCGFTNKSEAENTLRKLDVLGACILEGSVELAGDDVKVEIREVKEND